MSRCITHTHTGGVNVTHVWPFAGQRDTIPAGTPCDCGVAHWPTPARVVEGPTPNAEADELMRLADRYVERSVKETLRAREEDDGETALALAMAPRNALFTAMLAALTRLATAESRVRELTEAMQKAIDVMPRKDGDFDAMNILEAALAPERTET